MKKLLAMLLALLFVLSCGFAIAESDLDYCEINWYIGSQPPNDADLKIVNDALNEYLMEKINCKVKITYMTSPDWVAKMGTMLASARTAASSASAASPRATTSSSLSAAATTR